MGMSTEVVAIRPPDEKWRQMKVAWEACKAIGVPIPQEIDEFFNERGPDPNGVVIDLYKNAAVEEWRDNDSEGLQVNLEKLLASYPGVRYLRFTNSW